MLHVTNIVATGTLLLTIFFVWSTLRSDSREFTTIHAASHQPNHGLDQALQWTRASIVEKRPSVTSNRPRPTQNLDSKPPQSPPESHLQGTESSAFANVFYATTDDYACSALVNIYRLQHVLHSRYPIHVLVSAAASDRLVRAIQNADAHVHVEKPPALASAGGGYYQDCLLKLLAFKLHRLSPGLERVLAFDADQLIMRNIDDLFTGLPRVDLAAPRAYWLAKDFLASTFMMIELSDRLWMSVRDAFSAVGNEKFDMDIVNELLGE